MDAETAKTVAILSGGFSLLGALLGGLIAGVVNYVVARQNRATQVALAEQERGTRVAMAREEARREWRKQQVAGLLTVASQRPGVYTRIRTHIRTGQTEETSATLRRLVDTMPATESNWAALETSPIGQQVAAYVQADTAFIALFARQPPVVDGPEYEERGRVFRDATRALNEAAEQYIFGAD